MGAIGGLPPGCLVICVDTRPVLFVDLIPQRLVRQASLGSEAQEPQPDRTGDESEVSRGILRLRKRLAGDAPDHRCPGPRRRDHAVLELL